MVFLNVFLVCMGGFAIFAIVIGASVLVLGTDGVFLGALMGAAAVAGWGAQCAEWSCQAVEREIDRKRGD